MYTAIYIEVNLLGIILLLTILWKYRDGHDQRSASLAYRRVIISTLSITLVDIAWTVIDGRPGVNMITLNYLLNFSYLILMGVVSCFWLQFVLLRLHQSVWQRRSCRVLLSVPLIVLFILCCLSPWTHWFFSIGDDNVYRRGPLLFIQQIICYGYLLAAAGYALIHVIKATSRDKRVEALTLASFVLLPAGGSVLNLLYFGLPSIWPLTAISLMMVYLNLQSQQISTDELTGLNNRRQFDRYLLSQLEDTRREGFLYLLLIDIDAFKKINDTYGHLTGDAALVQAADLLKQVSSIWDCFLARYGGDEFAIVFKTHDPSRIAYLKNDLHEAFRRFNDAKREPYRLTISIGSNVSRSKTPDELIAQADNALYQAKAAGKATR